VFSRVVVVDRSVSHTWPSASSRSAIASSPSSPTPPSTTPRARPAAASGATPATAAASAPTRAGICHSYAPDGRCISLLKILLTNFCQYDCLYCVNRVSSNVPRARFTIDEVVQLTLDFYRRNCIEGLFLSSGIIRSPDYTMEQVVEVARRAARGARLPRLHPPQDHPRRRARAAAARRPLRRPAVDQHRAAHRAGPGGAGAREGRRAIKRSMARLRVHIDDARARRATRGQARHLAAGAKPARSAPRVSPPPARARR
jgi:hypothetical protein